MMIKTISNKWSSIIFLFLSCSVLHSQVEDSISNPALRDTILILLSLDIGPERYENELSILNQTELKGYIDSVQSFQPLEQRKYAVKKFQSIVESRGLPTYEEIGGGRPFEATFILILHSGDPVFMRKHLESMKTNFLPISHSVYEDKICFHEKIPQIYGTQVIYSQEEKRLVFHKIEDPANVDKRRLGAGHTTLEEYAKKLGMDWEKEKEYIFR